MSKHAICPECNEPCGPYLPGAEVYHWSCLAARFKALRKEWEKETGEERNQRMHGLPLNQAYDQQKLLEETCVLMTCPRCGRQDYQMEVDTGLCLVCIGKELESV